MKHDMQELALLWQQTLVKGPDPDNSKKASFVAVAYAEHLTRWRDISTAPKDGTEILGYNEQYGAVMVRWIAPIDFMTESEMFGMSETCCEQADWFCADFLEGSRLEGDLAPTLWKPIELPEVE